MKPTTDPDRRRIGVQRTVIILAIVAVLIYGGFILSGVNG